MFAQHQPQLAKLGRSGPDGFERIATFALCTIRQPLRIAVADYPLARAGKPCSAIFGSKYAGIAKLRAQAGDIWERCEDAFENADDDDAADIILGAIQDIPALGPAKAGFVAQMIYGLSGCIDTHNLTRFELPERTFRGREAKYSEARFRQTVRDYNSFCRKVGGTAYLWDSWCQYLADRDPVNYPNAERVSELHLAPLEN